MLCFVLAGFNADFAGAVFAVGSALTPGRDGASGAMCSAREAFRWAEGTASFADVKVACTKGSAKCHITRHATRVKAGEPWSVGGDIAR